MTLRLTAVTGPQNLSFDSTFADASEGTIRQGEVNQSQLSKRELVGLTRVVLAQRLSENTINARDLREQCHR